MVVLLTPGCLKQLAITSGLVLCALPATAERLIVRTYTMADGLASDRVLSLSTDRDGFLWVSTESGLSRFDGSVFTTYSTPSGLPDAIVNSFLQTRAGTRWVATNGGGIARMDTDAAAEDGRFFTSFSVGDSELSMRVNVLFETRDGALLAGTDDGLYRSPIADGEPRFERIRLAPASEPESEPQVWSIVDDPRGALWIGTSAGLFGLGDAGRLEQVPISPVQGADHVWTTVFDREGRLWLGHDLGLVVWAPPDLTVPGAAAVEHVPLLENAMTCALSASARAPVALPAAAGQACRWNPADRSMEPRSRVRPELEAADGTLWMTSPSGPIAFDGARFQVYTEPRIGSTYVPGSLIEDAGGDLWVISTTGLARIQRRGFVHYTREDGLVEPEVSRIFEGPDGGLYAVTPASRIHRFDEGRWTAVRPNVPADVGRGGRSTYGAVLVDHRGEWWVGSGEGLFRFPRVGAIEELERIRPRAHYTVADGLADNEIWELYEDRRGDLWIAGRFPRHEPLTRWRRETGDFQRFGSTHGLPARSTVRSFTEDRAGNLWLSFTGALVRYDGTRFDVLTPGSVLPDGTVGTFLHVDERGGLWAIVGNVPIYIPDPATAEPEVVPHSIPLRPLSLRWFGVFTGDEGWIYALTSQGLARLQPGGGGVHELGRGAPFTSIGRAYRDRQGRFWFATADGILRYEPRPSPARRPPPVWIDGVHVAGVPQPIPPMGVTHLPPLRLTADQRQIRIDYFGLGFGTDEPLRFQHRLGGVSDAWSDPTVWRSVLYAGLGPGRYRFRVRAVSTTGRASAQPATVSFTIPPPVWLRGWFLILLALVLTALLVAAHRLRVRRLLELERVRTRIAADLHDDLGASLARVSLLAEAARRTLSKSPEAAEPLLGEIGETSRALVAAAGDIAYSIDPGRGSLDGLVARLRRFAEELLADSGVAWRLEVAGDTAGIALSSDQRRHVLAILKEGLHNAVRHGRPRRLDLMLSVRDGILSAELVDDGCGFSLAAAEGGTDSAVGHGLRNMSRRAREVGGRLQIDSDPGAGSRLRLRMPL